ncbi:MAG TPA: hypothetical protein VIZ69_11700, partial [Thermoanaerobaculia bacterium]
MRLAAFAFLLAFGVPLALPHSQSDIEIRQPGHDPSVRWTAAGTLAMVFVREETDGGRLYYTDSGKTGVATAISPPGARVVAQPQTGPSLEILPDKTYVVVYSVSVPPKHGSEIRAQRSSNGGATW